VRRVRHVARAPEWPEDLPRTRDRDRHPAELAELRELYKAIKAGARRGWTALDQALAERGEEAAAEGAEPSTTTKPGLAGLTEKLQQQAAATTHPTAAATTTAPATAKGCDHAAIADQLAKALPIETVTCTTCGEEVPGRFTNADADRAAVAQEQASGERPARGAKPARRPVEE
jgi:hypothetical protein